MNKFEHVIIPAQMGMKEYKVPASVTMAQWALESGYGKSMPVGSNNPFGIKASEGQPFVECLTHEVEHGITHTVYQKFRKFENLAEAFSYHAQLLTHPQYHKAMAVCAEPEAFAHALTGVYATDPKYGEKLVSIMQVNDLHQYDVAQPEAEV